ncbi:SRPBCC domain-containing protein [Comamonas sp. 26]|uniref:SRPBCC domain-containing protein n=1 Tax=Comamonas sp. 26 TaxID=2035201 RepID=UPI000C181FEA|nr:SRPBCC domain-containing protein [Comamonas sp. 26]PIG08211.1 hypothetical protein CLU84_1051 [Comamonas sp. 26]
MLGILLISVLIFSIALGLAFLRAPQAELHTCIEIDATPERVWELLGNPGSYGQWNPFIVSMQGELVQGGRLINQLQSSRGRRMEFRPQVLTVQAARELRWRGRLFFPRIFDGEHFFELQPMQQPGTSHPRTRLMHGERFRGVLLWWMDVEEFRPDFERMNLALKSAAEQQNFSANSD